MNGDWEVPLARIEARLEAIFEKQDKMLTMLTGADDPGKGLIVKVDRLEQAEERHRWFHRAALGALLAVAAQWILKLWGR